ncbi:MAG: glycosyltransferase family 4 protein [Armatimonadota bacterium]
MSGNSEHKNPRVLILATSYAPELRKPERRSQEFPRTEYVELSKRVPCDILDYAIYDEPGVHNAWRRVESRFRLDFHLALLGYRRAKDYDVVVLMSERVAIPYMMMQRVWGRRAATVYVSAHSSHKQAQLARNLQLFSSLDIAVSNTHAQRDFLVNDVGIRDSSIHTVLYAADEEFFTPGGRSGDYIFSAGGIAGRDYATLFDAVSGLPVTVKIAAGGRGYGPSAKRRLPPIPENVEMLPATDSAGMRELYRNAAMVVVPLRADRKDAAGCSVVLEAMCCGKAVVAGHTGGMEDYVTDGKTGRLVECQDPTALSHIIMDMRSRPETQSLMGQSARTECGDRLSLRSLVNGLANSVSELCS